MTLTKKILLFILLICVIFSSLYFLLFYRVIAVPFEEQKKIRSQKIAAGVLAVFDSEINRIETLTKDWAMWDSMYNYSSKPTDAFERDLAVPQVLLDADLSLIVVVDGEEKLILLCGYNNVKEEYISFDLLTQSKGAPWKFLERSFNMNVSERGIVDSQHGPLLLVSAPILHSDNSGPRNGRVMMGRLIDTSFEQKISAALGEAIRVFTGPNRLKLSIPTGNNDTSPLYPQMKETRTHMIVDLPVNDIWGNEIFTVRVNAQKRLFEILENATRLFFLLLIAGFILFGTTSYFIIHRLVVRRVKTIAGETDKIVSFEDLSIRIPESYSDEITFLVQNINKMLRRLETEKARREEIEHMLALNEKLIILGRISSNIAHEVNNPLFAIANSFELIKKYLPTGDDELTPVVEMVDREIRRVRNITRNMHQMTIRQIEKPSLSNITDIVNAAVNVTLWSKQLRDAVVDYKKRDRSFPLYCNPETLQQVFMNLIVNAVEAMDGKGTLIIDVHEDGDDYTVDFIDTGPGIRDDMKDTVFAPHKTTKLGIGAGLGLYISKNILINHGGTITLDDNYKNGAHFIVRLPQKGGPINENKRK
jgi:signal transduction histidine kinase